jgi:glutathione S-transferase
MSQVTLYRKDGACSWIPHALLHHLAIPFTAVSMIAGPDGYEAADGSLTHAEFRVINPMGYVPVLFVDGESITEMPAVLTMIAELSSDEQKTKELLGRTAIERARVAEWMAWLSGTLHSLGFAACWRQYRFVEDHEECYPAVQEKGGKVIEQCFERIDLRLRGRRYAVGDTLTLADFNLCIFWRWGTVIGYDMKNRFPSYTEALQRMQDVPGVREAVTEEGMSPWI